MSKNAYLQECQWCGKQYRLATKLKYCCGECRDECRDAAALLKKKLKVEFIDEALEYHKKGLDVVSPDAEVKPKRNPFLRNAENKILFPVRYTSGAVRWEWTDSENIESGVRVI